MKKHFIRRLSIIIASLLVGLLLTVLIVPLFFSPSPKEGLSATEIARSAESEFVTIPFEGTDGIEFHIIDRGVKSSDEPVFLLLHGSNYNAFTWDLISEGLAEYGRAIAYDQIPYGLSEKLIEGDWSGPNPYSTEAALQQMISLMDTLGLENVYLVGSSYGGTLALRAALEFPERITGLILVDAAVFVDETIPEWIMKSPQMNNIGPYLARSIGTSTAFYEKCYSDPSYFKGKRMQKTMVMTEMRNWDFALWEYLKAWGAENSDFRNHLSEITNSTLIISGTEDLIVSPEDSRKLHERLPDSRLEMIEGSGHLPHEESPAEFLERVFSWIDSVESP